MVTFWAGKGDDYRNLPEFNKITERLSQQTLDTVSQESDSENLTSDVTPTGPAWGIYFGNTLVPKHKHVQLKDGVR